MCVTDIQQRDDKKGEDEVEAWPQIGLTPSDSLFPNRGLSQYTNSCCSGKKGCPKGGGEEELPGVKLWRNLPQPEIN